MGSRGRVTWGALLFSSLLAVFVPLSAAFGPGRVVARGDERTLTLYEIHTKETTTATFKRDGEFVPEALSKFNWALRDWRRNQPTKMDPRLFDMIWELQQQVGSSGPVHVVSGYRAPATNAALRSRGGGQAKFSQHTLGKATDVHFPDVPMRTVRNSALVHEWGGVGYYPTSAIPFVHVDTGRVRAWPRLPRQELAMLFPNGPTRHRPADGGILTDADRKRARIALASLDRQKQVEFLVARAERDTPAREVYADAAPARPATPPATVVALAEPAPNSVPGLSDLGAAQRNLWYYRVAGGAAMQEAALDSNAPAAAAPRTAETAAPAPASGGRMTAARTEPKPVRVAALQTPAAPAAPAVDGRLWVNGTEQRREFLAAAFGPVTLGFGRPAGPKATGNAAAGRIAADKTVAAAAAPAPIKVAPSPDRLAALVEKTSLDRHLPAVPEGFSYRQEDNVAYAPDFDDDHPDELAYRPFAILPLMNAEPIVSNKTAVAMIERDYRRVVDFLSVSENIGMQFRPAPAAARMRWMDQFHGRAIVDIQKRAEADLASETAPVPVGNKDSDEDLPALPPLKKLAAR